VVVVAVVLVVIIVVMLLLVLLLLPLQVSAPACVLRFFMVRPHAMNGDAVFSLIVGGASIKADT
jgi:hypothetical protein